MKDLLYLVLKFFNRNLGFFGIIKNLNFDIYQKFPNIL
jgi:hypothetical protein